MKKSILFIGLLLGVSAARGALITDDFNRGDTDYATPGVSIGGTWANGIGSDLWSVTNGTVNMDVTSGSAALINNGLTTISGGGTNFTLSADIARVPSGTMPGLVFNFQDDNNYYLLRLLSDKYQVFAVYDGTIESVLSVTEGAFADNTFYTVTITSSDAYNYSFTITEQGSSTVLNSTTSWTDPNSRFTGGYAGFYGAGNTAVLPEGSFDNFSLEVLNVTLVTDDFNRTDTVYSPSAVGGTWANGIGSDQWSITNGTVNMDVTSGSAALINNGLTTISGDGTTFVLSADIARVPSGTIPGLVFNFQDDNNYYLLRLLSDKYQVFTIYNGDIESVLSVSEGTFADNTFYTVTITSDEAYNYNFTITEQGSSTVLNSTTNWVDPNGWFTGGYAGLYGAGNTTALPEGSFDNFSLEIIPEGGYAGWAGQWGGTNVIGSGSVDFDEDGLSNIYEYGLDGNPADELDQGTLPEYTVLNAGGTNVFSYIHPQRFDSEGELAYSLALAADLVVGDWVTNAGYTVTGTNVTSETLNFVTNTIPMEEARKYIRLIIE